MKMRRPLPLITASILAATLLAAAPATASAQEPTAVVCSGGTLTLTVDTAGYATGSGTLADCTAPGRPDVNSATVSVTGNASILMPGLTSVTSTDTITWNTGDISTITTQRTYIGKPEQAIETGAGATLSGIFHPSFTLETGRGIPAQTKSDKKASATAIEYSIQYAVTARLASLG
jgi:hypothetical protein